MNQFGSTLRHLRRAAGITQRDLAARTSLDFSYVSKLENCRVPPPAADTVVKIAHVLGVTPDKLLALSGKLSSDVTDAVASMAGAQEFLRLSAQLSLTDEEWRRLSSMAQQWRHKPE